MTAYLHCPAGTCRHREEYDPAGEGLTDSLMPLTDADRAYDQLGEHLRAVHGVPSKDVGALLSQARRTTTETAGA